MWNGKERRAMGQRRKARGQRGFYRRRRPEIWQAVDVESLPFGEGQLNSCPGCGNQRHNSQMVKSKEGRLYRITICGQCGKPYRTR